MQTAVPIFLITVLATGCTLTLPVESNRIEFATAEILSVEMPASVGIQEPLPIKLRGQLPDSTWHIHHFDLIAGNNSLRISPVASRDESSDSPDNRNTLFDRIVTYHPERKGWLTVHTAGSNQTLTDSIWISE